MIEEGFQIDVLDKGFVRFVDHLGSDRRIVEAARISYHSPSKGDDADRKLLHYLYRNRHTSPFEQCSITFNIKMPIFVMRQFVRHRTFKLNEVSARYTKLESDYYVPDNWRAQCEVNKQGSVDILNWNPEGLIGYFGTYDASSAVKRVCDEAHAAYQSMIELGIAREMARMILPVNFYTEIYVNCDLHNLIHFLRLRQHSHAQLEIRQYANAMYDIMERLFPWTAEAFSKYQFKVEETQQESVPNF